ncbi:hypothetical protein EU527_15010 [Candidatus Thorarchaeota archaeon]|nr:MAG: hypothetical protein EU527_15010 [Candidatus Thorarchaeota archaeon]
MAQEVQKTNHVVYISTNGQMIDIYFFRGEGWRFANFGEKHRSPLAEGNPAAFVYNVNNSQNIVFRGHDKHIHTLFFIRGTGWANTNLTGLVGAPLAEGDPSAYTYHVFNTQHVIYRSSDNHLHQLYSAQIGNWKHADMTVQSGAPLASGRPTTYVYGMNDSQNIVYRSQDGHIYTLYFVRGEGWKHVSLTGATGGPLANGDPSSYTYHVFNTQHVIYRGQDNHIYQMYSDQTGQWKISNMTEKTGAPLATGTPTSFVDPVHNSQNLVYRGQDGHIHDIWFIRGEGWKHMNLTAATGMPLAAGNPFGYTFDLFSTQHIMYRTQNGHLIQLYSGQPRDWKYSNLTEKTGAPIAKSDPTCYTYDLK